MIGNLLNILAGLWLAYSVIFSVPAGSPNNAVLAGVAVAVIILAAWARQTDWMRWQSGTNVVLGVILLVTAGLHWAIGLAPLMCFWVVLLCGITVSILAMWSMLYRGGTARTDRASLPEAHAGVGGG